MLVGSDLGTASGVEACLRIAEKLFGLEAK
jgi:hypothetical protein